MTRAASSAPGVGFGRGLQRDDALAIAEQIDVGTPGQSGHALPTPDRALLAISRPVCSNHSQSRQQVWPTSVRYSLRICLILPLAADAIGDGAMDGVGPEALPVHQRGSRVARGSRLDFDWRNRPASAERSSDGITILGYDHTGPDDSIAIPGNAGRRPVERHQLSSGLRLPRVGWRAALAALR